LSERGAGGRFAEIHQVGVFSEPRGRFVLFRAVDRQREDTSVYMHMYLDLPDDRITIADGWQNFGACLY
jgi:hypothetical protein